MELFNKSIFKFLFFDQYLNNGKGELSTVICKDFNLYMTKLNFENSSNTNHIALQEFKNIFNDINNYQEQLNLFLDSLENSSNGFLIPNQFLLLSGLSSTTVIISVVIGQVIVVIFFISLYA